MSDTRGTVILCRGQSGWSIFSSHLGQTRQEYAALRFSEGQALAFKDAFGGDHMGGLPDLIVTSREALTLEEASEFLTTPAYGATLFLPEGGSQLPTFWSSIVSGRDAVGPRFHVTNLRALVEVAGLNPMEDRASSPEFEIRRNWNGCNTFEAFRRRQIEESEAAERSRLVHETMTIDKEKDVRTWGAASGYFHELYGHLSPHEWHELWQGWQREEARSLGPAVVDDAPSRPIPVAHHESEEAA